MKFMYPSSGIQIFNISTEIIGPALSPEGSWLALGEDIACSHISLVFIGAS
jgi:hypothetical protein